MILFTPSGRNAVFRKIIVVKYLPERPVEGPEPAPIPSTSSRALPSHEQHVLLSYSDRVQLRSPLTEVGVYVGHGLLFLE